MLRLEANFQTNRVRLVYIIAIIVSSINLNLSSIAKEERI